jgi:hypothetical protein
MAKKKTEEKKTNSEKLARQAGKVAAKAERSASEAVERAKTLTNYVTGFFGKPIGAAVHAGQETIGQLSSGVSHLLSAEGVATTAGNALEDVKDAIEARVKAIVRELGVPTREEYEALRKRVAELEAATGKPKQLRKPAAKPAAKAPAKAAAKPAARPAAKPARARTGSKPTGAK